MNVNDPLSPSKFAADCGDLLITDVDQSQEFVLMADDQVIIKEVYNYDNDGMIRVAGLDDVLSQTVYGELPSGALPFEQSHAKADMQMLLTGSQVFRKDVYSMRLKNPRDPEGAKMVLAAGAGGVCHPGQQLLLTVIGRVTVRLMFEGKIAASAEIGVEGKVMTVDCDPMVLFPEKYGSATSLDIGGELQRTIIHSVSGDAVTLRFLNRYDMPECVTAAYLTEKPSVNNDVATMYGRRTRFAVTPATEYSLFSGALRHQDQYDTWQDLLTSRKAQILWQGQWTDIIVTKSNYTRTRRNFYGSQIEVSFQTANPLLTL